MSELYKPICFLKDHLKLFKTIMSPESQNLIIGKDRQSQIHPLSYNFSSDSKLTRMMGYYCYNLIDQTVMNSDFASNTINSILYDESHRSLRDLPAYFYCANKLLRQMNKILDRNEQQQKSFWKIIKGRYEDNGQDDAEMVGDGDGNEYLNIMNKSINSIQQSNVTDQLEAMLVLPYEIKRKQMQASLIHQYEYLGKLRHHLYHLQSIGVIQQFDEVKEKVAQLEIEIAHYQQLLPNELKVQKSDSMEQANQTLQQLLQIIKDLQNCCLKIAQIDINSESKNEKQMNQMCKSLSEQLNLIESQLVHLIFKMSHIYLQYAHLTDKFLTDCLCLVVSGKKFVQQISKKIEALPLLNDLKMISYPYQALSIWESKQMVSQNKKAQETDEMQRIQYENRLLLALKSDQIVENNADLEVKLHTLDYFVHREIARKMAEENELDQQEEQVLKVPFKMKVQAIMDENKAMDERTAKDKEEAERAAALEIEANFPSYFDELSKEMVFNMGIQNQDERPEGYMRPHERPQEITIDEIVFELTEQEDVNEDIYRTDWLRLNLQCVLMDQRRCRQSLKSSKQNEFFGDTSKSWMEDGMNCLKDQLRTGQQKASMNISDVKLPSTYNFYHDAYPVEARLIYYPLATLQSRVRDILKEYESPILNDLLFLTNYMLTKFNSKTTPLMKMLTGMELLLEKLDEWDSYSSKRLNSCHEETQKIKLLIIRYRKLQIISWRNLLQHKKHRMIRQDVENCLRLTHTIEKQIFDARMYAVAKPQLSRKKKELLKSQKMMNDRTELEIFEIVDLFIRDSSLGIFEFRLKFVTLLNDSLKFKYGMIQSGQTSSQLELINLPIYDSNVKAQILERLKKVINIIEFVVSYYSQFKDKLARTIARLDAQARDKVKTLIDVSKWNLMKFSQVKNNIDKTHRQLNKACKLEEEILMQNIQSLVLTSSRKKYIFTDAGGDKLLSLDNERGELVREARLSASIYDINQTKTIIKQINFFQKNHLIDKWPDHRPIESMMDGFFERLKIVRDVNKKHIQRKAMIDLLKFMKDQGLQANFQDNLQQWIMKGSLVQSGNQSIQDKLSKYFYKAHELLLIMESSSQTSENSDLRNVDILRIKGFSMSLIQKICILNSQIENLTKCNDDIEKLLSNSPLKQFSQIESDNRFDDQYRISPSLIKQSIELELKLTNLKSRIVEQVATIKQLQSDGVNKNQIASKNELKDQILVDNQHVLKQQCDKLEEDLNQIYKDNIDCRQIKQLIENGREMLAEIKSEVNEFYNKISELQNGQIDQEQNEISSDLSKKVQQGTKIVQVIYQDFYNTIQKFGMKIAVDEKPTEGQRKESFDQSTNAVQSLVGNQAGQPPVIDIDDLSIEEQIQFTSQISLNLQQDQGNAEKKLSGFKLFSNHFKKVLSLDCLEQDDRLRKEDMDQLILAMTLAKQLQQFIRFAVEQQSAYLCSLCKLSYVSQRIFVYLIFQGFCGVDDQDGEDDEKQQEADDKYLDGCGMGDGQGQNNVSDEIEHQEQLEGLKNYESDEEQGQNNEEQQKNEEEDDNDFEMQDDFEGQLHDEEQKKEDDDKDEKSDADDQLDQVDDMLDNELWDQNMQDMEDKENENNENEDQEDREIDLGDRELQDHNQIDEKEKEMASGDHDKQKDKKEKEQEQQQEQDNQAEEIQADQSEPEEDQDKPDDQPEEEMDQEQLADLPLNRAEHVEDDESEKQEDEKSQSAEDLDQEMKDEMDDVGTEQQSQDIEHPEGDQDDQADQENEDEIDENMEEKDNQDRRDEDHDQDGSENQSQNSADQIGDDSDENEMDAEAQQNNDKEEQDVNVKKGGEQNLNENQNETQQNQSKADQDLQTQYDVDGNDILFQLAQKVEQQSKKKENNAKEKQNKQQQAAEELDEKKKQIEQPRMAEDQNDEMQDQQKQNDQQSQEALEYEYDQNEAEQMQGKLATDNVEHQIDQEMLDENEQNQQQENIDEKEKKEEEVEELNDENIQKTEQAISKQQKQSKDRSKNENEKDEQEDQEMQSEAKDIDIIEEYNKYIENKKDRKNFVEEHDQEDKMEIDQQIDKPILKGAFEEFDYNQARQELRQQFDLWRANSDDVAESTNLLSNFKAVTSEYSASLCEQLRIVLEPQMSQQLQGDYKTGKRLNMKKVISFIASNYRNDKIWLRRTMPSKRDYKILIAIDDSLSMKEQNLGFFSLEAMVTLVEALNRLEIGQVSIARIRDRLELIKSFEDAYSNERSAFVINQFEFTHNGTQSLDLAMANFMRDANKIMDLQNCSSQLQGGMSCPFTIIISDGRFNKANVLNYIQEAQQKKYLYIFVILDTAGKNSIVNLRSAVKSEDGKSMKIEPYLKDFPFPYYCIVSDLQQLPSALGSILVQWFSLVSSGSSS